MHNLSRPLAVLFDWDGTLVDSSVSVKTAHNYVRRAMGHPDFTEDEFMRAARIGTARETFTVLYPDRVQEAIDLYYSQVPMLRANNLALIDQAQEFVENLHGRGIPLGVVSNMGHGPLVDEVARLGWDKYFATVIGAGQAARGKPSPDPVYLAAERMGLTRPQLRDVWFVGDMETDEKAAKSAGCPFFYYSGHGSISNESERKNMRATRIFSDYGALWRDIADIITT